MALVRFNLDLSVPSIGARPPLLHLGTEIKVTVLHVLLGGAIAAAIVWIGRGMPMPRPADVDVEAGDGSVVPARFGRGH